MFNDFLVGVVLSILLGALIGSQREIMQQKLKRLDFAGFRTFTLISLMGFIFGFLGDEILGNSYLFLVGVAGLFLIGIFAYSTVTKIYPKHVSAISEVSAILTFVIGFLVSQNMYQVSIMITILIALILFLGNKLHVFAKNLQEKEVFATLKFAIISLIILPLLPNQNYTLLDFPIISNLLKSQNFISNDLLVQLDVFNFYYIWLMVVFISGIAYVGYILMKTIGAEKGIEITGFLGGLMSSTALTTSFSIESKRLTHLYIPLAIGVIIACSTMFFRIIFEVAVLNSELLLGIILLLGIMGLVGYFGAFYLFKKYKLNHVKKIDVDSPFTIGPAIKFSILFVFVLFISKLFSIIFGNSGIYIVSFLSGISDVDAITISLSNLAFTGDISNITAQIGIVVAAFANTIVKAGIAFYLGSKKFSKIISIMFFGIILVGLIFMGFLFFSF